MSEEKPQSSPTSASRIPRLITTKPALTPSPPAVAPEPKFEASETRPSGASVPPPPPSRRPLSERPVTLGTSPLPPPVSSRPILPKAPPVARVGKQHPSDADLKRLEEENSDLRKKVSAQREATKVEHKNVERLRSEVAHLKAKAAAHRSSPTPVPVRAPTSTLSRSQVDQLRADHSQEIRELKRKHQQNLDELNKGHRSEIAQLKREHQAELAQKDKMALQHETQQLNSADHNVENLKHEIDDLKQKNTSFRLKNTELREQNGNLEKQLRDAEQRAAAVPAASAAPQDDLTELKGVGPKVARALQAAGITTFGQIAAWTESDIDDIAPKIKTAAGRIRNNDWVAQAKHRVS